MNVGDSFYFPVNLPNNDAHLWVILLICPSSGQLIMANLTTEKLLSDTTTLIQAGEHRFVRHPTIVSYADAKLAPIARVEEAFRTGIANPDQPFSADLLKRVQAGLVKSIFTPKKVKDFYLSNSNNQSN